LPWQNSTCSVKSGGSEYRGNCWIHPEGSSCPSTCGGKVGNELFNRVADGTIEGRGRRLSCSNLYMPWKLVFVPGRAQPVCAHEYGMTHSFAATFNQKSECQNIPVGTTVPCRILVASYDPEGCVVALNPLTELVGEEEVGSFSSWTAFWFLFPCLICGWMSACFLCVWDTIQSVSSTDEKQAFAEGHAADTLQWVGARSPRLVLPPGHWSQWNSIRL